MVYQRVIWLLILFLLAGCTSQESFGTEPDRDGANKKASQDTFQPDSVSTDENSVRFQLVARETELEVRPGKSLSFYTYGGTVPGREIRVKQGQHVEVELKNELDEPVTIHWHGYPVPNEMDGVPGLTQNAVEPGETFTYTFKATIPGTYWYHSHQHSAEQVDRGLYGALIVEEKDETRADREYTFILDEMNSDGNGSSGGMRRMMGRMMGSGDYDMFTVNGKAGSGIPPHEIKTGERVRLRFINAGYITHYLHLGSIAYDVFAVDGQKLSDPVEGEHQLLPIAPGQRVDVLFEAPDGSFFIRDMLDHPAADQMRIPMTNVASKNMHPEVSYQGILWLSESEMGTEWKPVAADSYDQVYTMELGHGMGMGGMAFLINGKAFPDTEPLKVRRGDRVKVTLQSSDPMFDHPMHLHGHFFQVLSKNGEELDGDPVMKDTLLVRPGETYEVAFVADNPGDWLFHCHELTHAADGMVTTLDYEDHDIPEHIDRSQLAE
ncbi:MAG: multicopper oxidase family protein [Bacillaceae bacterium]|nr:multicopper oxidase family protein [Bacillaceae bacterium]